MHTRFPEGFIFSHVLYGLAWVELGMHRPQRSTLHSQALDAARWALSKVDLPDGQRPFDSSLQPTFGVFLPLKPSSMMSGP